jgi:hypothetical protein
VGLPPDSHTGRCHGNRSGPDRVRTERTRTRATVTEPSQTGTQNDFVYPAVDPNGDVYLAIAGSSPSDPGAKTMYVSRSTDDGNTWGTWHAVANANLMPGCCPPNTRFRDGILEHFAASEDHPGHLYVAWEARPSLRSVHSITTAPPQPRGTVTTNHSVSIVLWWTSAAI